ncbi:precorrin-2 C20-methyltransferase [Desulfotomaculum arcticum]|uniref:Precorrin-2 C20-methyltransferase n=1 Tax=Desulfotruncus arcticus DSM 17038 TaxID=1121424 RepID=A0A1I2RY94_9FIRM|nr:precorrin-2 C(20)-methyltransferase [Desulfotruncus arcticus]SFG44499.1 precorrin-2 C20-methyltransferase [Desulfotomaculum arcticum] [Desulfotruncus arcticus DSM 17038]
MTGIFYGIGVGPGDPELLTIKAQRILSDIDVLCVPKSRMEKDSLALTVVKNAVAREYKILELEFPMSRDQKLLEKCWREAGAQVAAELLSGKNVAFITIGDPTLYSTYGYLLRYIREAHSEIITSTIPGITSISACSAFIQEPLVEREEKLAIIPAAYNLDDLRSVLDLFDSVVLMKVNKRLPELINFFKEIDNVETYYVSRCGYPDEFSTSKLEEIEGKNLDYMSLMIVKKAR